MSGSPVWRTNSKLLKCSASGSNGTYDGSSGKEKPKRKGVVVSLVQTPITPKINLGRVAQYHDALVRASVDDEGLRRHWSAIERREAAQNQARQLREAWISYYERLAESYRRFAAEHEQKAAGLLEAAYDRGGGG